MAIIVTIPATTITMIENTATKRVTQKEQKT